MSEAGATWELAHRHRADLPSVMMVAVTGSCGKTTTKNLIGDVLGSRFRGSTSSGSNNCGDDVARDLLAVRADDDFFVQELGAWGPGTLDAGLHLIEPRIAVVTNLRDDHYSAFHGPRGAQAEKGKLVQALPSTGVAVLNWDDRYVRELADRTSARVLSFGVDPSAELHAAEISSGWPSPLSFLAIHGEERVQVSTRLHGNHLVGSALAALAVGLAFGLPLREAAAVLATAAPTPRRMTVVSTPDGVTFVRDDFKAPADSVPEVLRFLGQATAARRVAVFGRLADFPGRSRPVYTTAFRRAAATVDAVVFVGQRAVELWGEHTNNTAAVQQRIRYALGLTQETAMPGADLFVFGTVDAAGDFLDGYLRSGDLVLLKGSGPHDHLERIMLRRQQPVDCRRTACGRMNCCDDCELLAVLNPTTQPDTRRLLIGR